MTLHTLHLTHAHQPTFRTAQVRGLFDLTDDSLAEQITADVPGQDEPWQIGAIIGPSGTGKTSLAKAAFPTAIIPSVSWHPKLALIDQLGTLSIQTLATVLIAVGLGSAKLWLRPVHLLSEGERFRAELARAILLSVQQVPPPSTANAAAQIPLLIDEFTSSLDRLTAQTVCLTLAKLVRRGELLSRVVVLSCHADVAEWLEPDWLLETRDFQLKRGPLQRPAIRLRVVRCDQQQAHQLWQQFARHHYLTSQLPAASVCYLAEWQLPSETLPQKVLPAAFCAVSGSLGHYGWKRISRLVTLPPFQGLGIGSQLAQRVAEVERASGKRVSLATSHPGMARALRKSSAWILREIKPLGSSRHTLTTRVIPSSCGRPLLRFEYVGHEINS